MTTPAEPPDYDDLPLMAQGGRCGWGVFGENDQVGMVNLMSPDRVVEAARLVRRGARFSLDLPWGTFDPPLNPNRRNPRHRVIDQPGGVGFDDAWDDVYPQAGSQWDSLAHVGVDRHVYYNGATPEEIRAGTRNAIDHWAGHGMIGRGVLLDMPRAVRDLGGSYHPGKTVELGVQHLEQARISAGVEFRPGDVILLYTGYTAWYAEQPGTVRTGLPGNVRAPGLEHSEAVCRYLWDAKVSAIGSDTFAVEAWPADTSVQAAPFGFLHHMLIGSFGMALGELWWLHDVAQDCATTGVYEGMLVSVPTPAPGGIGSAPNAVFIK